MHIKSHSVNCRTIQPLNQTRYFDIEPVLIKNFDEGIDYEIIRLSAQPNYSGSDSYPKKQVGKPIEEYRALTIQAAIGLYMVSQSKGGKRVRGMMLDILDLFKAGIRDPSNKIFDAITYFFGSTYNSFFSSTDISNNLNVIHGIYTL